jgi:hypothetical protein
LIGKIFAPVFGGGEDELTLALAADIAKYFHAHVEVVGAADARNGDAEGGAGDQLSTDDVSVRLTKLNKGLRTVFENWLREWGVQEQSDGTHLGLASASWIAVRRSPAAELHDRAKLSDLVCIAVKRGSQARSAIERIVFFSGRPVLMQPVSGRHAVGRLIGKPIVVGWNGSAEATRAVAAAIPFLRVSTSVEVVSIGEDTVNAADAFEMAKYLAWHGILARASGIARKDWTGADIVDIAMNRNAEMLVMGAHRHYDKDLGRNATRHVLDQVPMTLLMMS